MSRVIYSIEGNIGSGKSTLLKLLQKSVPSLFISPEPITQWQHVTSFNLLSAYYEQPKRWSYTFQNYALLTRMNHLHKLLHSNKLNDKLLLSERSVIADKEIFAKLLHKQQKMNEMQFQLYLRFFDNLHNIYTPHPIHRHIYLRTDPQKCFFRIKKRARPEEQKINLDYLKKIHERHQEWLKQDFMIQGSHQFQDDEAQSKIIVQKIKVWLNWNN